MHELAELTDVVKSVARKSRRGFLANYEVEDLEQECWLKLVEVLPDLRYVNVKELRSMVYTILDRHMIGMVRKQRTRHLINQKMPMRSERSMYGLHGQHFAEQQFADQAMYKALEDTITDIDGVIPEHFLSQEQIFAYKELVQELVSWSQSKNALTKRLVKEMVDPSDKTLRTWHDMVEKYPHYKAFQQIPPISFAQIFGVNKLRIFRIVKEMRAHLVEQGFAIPGALAS